MQKSPMKGRLFNQHFYKSNGINHTLKQQKQWVKTQLNKAMIATTY